MAATMVLMQLQAQMALPTYARAPTLGLLYITDHYASQAQEVLDFLSAELPGVADWSGTVGVGVAGSGVEYLDEPALSVMLLDIAPDQYRVFSGVAPLPRHPASGFVAHTALVHADGRMPDLADLLAEVACRTETGYLFGGVSVSRSDSVQFAVSGNGNIAGQGAAAGVFDGGLSGVAFGPDVHIISRITQGCQPIGPVHTITQAVDNVVLTLDGEAALDVLLQTLDVSLQGDSHAAIDRVTQTFAGLVDAQTPTTHWRAPGHFGAETLVRPIVGLDGQRMGVALGQVIESGMRLAFCQRNATAARADLTRICTEIREELAPADMADHGADGHGADADVSPAVLPSAQGAGAPSTGVLSGDLAGDDGSFSSLHTPVGCRVAGAIYISCAGRGGAHFGGPSAELQWVRHALGDVPLVGFFAGGEIAYQHLYGYAGVLTVFVVPDGDDRVSESDDDAPPP